MRSRQIILPRSLIQMPNAPGRPDLWLAVAIAAGFGLGLAVARGDARPIILGALVMAALAAVVFRPEAVLMAWFLAILAHGRWLTYHKIGPLYVTEPLLALMTLVVAGRLLLSVNGHAQSTIRNRPLRFLLLLAAVMLVPGFLGMAINTAEFDLRTGRNALLVIYVLFGLIVASVTDLRRSYRWWFFVALSGPTIALLLVVTGHAGEAAETSTGAVRIAAHTFPLAFGIAPIVLAAAAREGFIRPMVAISGAIPFLVGLIFVNHRSAWLAFIAAATVLFVRRISPSIVVGGAALVVAGLLLFTGAISPTAAFGEEIERAKTVTSTSDPNARYRLDFWKALFVESIKSPLIGSGFDPYPVSVVPPTTVSSEDDPFPEPHNSFMAIAYRIGFIPFLLAGVMLVRLVYLGFHASRSRLDARERALSSALTAIVVFVGVASAFNVYLEAPYAGPLFWTSVGLLAHMVYFSHDQSSGDLALATRGAARLALR